MGRLNTIFAVAHSLVYTLFESGAVTVTGVLAFADITRALRSHQLLSIPALVVHHTCHNCRFLAQEPVQVSVAFTSIQVYAADQDWFIVGAIEKKVVVPDEAVLWVLLLQILNRSPVVLAFVVMLQEKKGAAFLFTSHLDKLHPVLLVVSILAILPVADHADAQPNVATLDARLISNLS